MAARKDSTRARSSRAKPVVEKREVTMHGNRLAYRIAGSGPVIVLVHGIAGTAQTWHDLQLALADRYTLIAPDLPGHGDSDKPIGDYSLGAMASTLRDLMVMLGHERATFVGHSLGGGIIMQFAYQFPDRCERMVLVSSGGLGQDVNLILRAACLPGADLVLSALAGPIALAGGTVARALGSIGWKPGPDLDEVSRGFASLADTETRAAFLGTLKSVVSVDGQRVDASNRLYLASEIPTLLVCGERDPIIPARHAIQAAEAMPGSKLVRFPDAGHMPHVDEPRAFAQALTDFIEQTEPCEITSERWSEILRGGVRMKPKR